MGSGLRHSGLDRYHDGRHHWSRTNFLALALGPEHHGTVVGGLVNLVLFLALLFWPSGDYDSSTPDFERTAPARSFAASGMNSVATDRIARASGEFGRRSF